MSWHYLRGQEGESWDPSCSGGIPDALSKLIPTVNKSSSPDNEMEFYHVSLSGMTLRLSMADLGGDLLTLLRAGFLVKTSVVREKVWESPAKVQACFSKCSESLKKYNLRLSSRKTVRTYVPRASVLWSRDLPAWGMWDATGCWELGTSVRHTNETACGSLLPTLTATSYGSNQGGAAGRTGKKRPNLTTILKTYGKKKLPTILRHDAWLPGVSEIDSNWKSPCLSAMLKWPTKEPTKPLIGRLNPTWAEWFQGWPLDWTDLRPLAMDKFRLWLRQHGLS